METAAIGFCCLVGAVGFPLGSYFYAKAGHARAMKAETRKHTSIMN